MLMMCVFVHARVCVCVVTDSVCVCVCQQMVCVCHTHALFHYQFSIINYSHQQKENTVKLVKLIIFHPKIYKITYIFISNIDTLSQCLLILVKQKVCVFLCVCVLYACGK